MSNGQTVLRIAPTRGWIGLALGELWQYRELLFFLTLRDIKVRYRQTVLGVLWALIVPLISTIVFTIVFARMANVSSDGLPYPVFNLAALLPWNFFAAALAMCANSVAHTSHLMSKVYFPRLIAPLAAVLGGLADFTVAFGLLIVAMVWYDVLPQPGLPLLLLPVFVVFTVLSALGTGLWLAGLSAKYRDVKHAVPFLIQAWLFVTPVVYSSNAVTPKYRTLLGVNPMAGVVEGFRWSLLGIRPHVTTMVISAVVALTLVISGAFFYRRVERTFADLL